MCDWAARAAYNAMAGSTPSRRWSRSATASTGGRAQPHVARPRADRDDDVLEARGAEHPDGARGRLLERLEQGVGRGVGVGGEAVGVLDDDDAPAAHGRAQRGLLHERAGLGDLDRQALGGDDLDVGVAAVEGGAALAALPAAAVGALQRRGERAGRRRAAGARAGP